MKRKKKSDIVQEAKYTKEKTPYRTIKTSLKSIIKDPEIHNKINEQTEKQKVSLGEFYANYYEQYKPKEVQWAEQYKVRSKIIYILIITICLALIIYLYNK